MVNENLPVVTLCPAGLPIDPETKVCLTGDKGETGKTGETGVKGETGDKGDRGKPGPALPVKMRRAIIFLFVLPLLISVVALAGLFHYAGKLSGEQEAVQRQQAAISRTQREITAATVTGNAERCASLAQIAAIPIPVPTPGNPSRIAWARFETVERHRGSELGCKMPKAVYVKVKPGKG